MALTNQSALQKLIKLVERAQSLRGEGLDHNAIAFKNWKRVTESTLQRIFGENSPQLQELNEVKFYRADRTSTTSQVDFNEGIRDAVLLLEGMLTELDQDIEAEPTEEVATKTAVLNTVVAEVEGEPTLKEPCVFIGHGRSSVWARLQIFLENNLKMKTVNYESEPRVGESIVPILEKMLDQATFAVLILTAEDETASGAKRARQNVIHEAGLFQGRLGFRRAILLRQEGTEDFSNVAGLQYISFGGEKIEQTFWQLQEVLKREGQLP